MHEETITENLRPCASMSETRNKTASPLAAMRPDFKLVRYKDGTAQVVVEGGNQSVELCYDRSAMQEATAERYRQLVEAAYDLGLAHSKKAFMEM